MEALARNTDLKMDSIHVAIVEDHPDIRHGMQFIINSAEGFSSTSYSNAEDALEGIAKELPDLVLMDISMPGMSGIECTSLLKAKYPGLHIMICSVYDDDDHVFNALAAGANGYILKSAAGQHLLDSLRDLANGGSPMSSIIARKVVQKFQNSTALHPRSISSEEASLTNRENEILDLLAKGYRNKEIAEQLFVSVNTIRTHIYNIYDKLHVQSRVEALNKTGRGYSK